MQTATRFALVALAFSVWSSMTNAQIYSCVEGGTKVFSDNPCSARGETIEVLPQAMDPVPKGENEAAQARIDEINADNRRQGYRRAVRDSQYAIESAQRAITQLNIDMDSELWELRRQVQLTTNDIEGAARRLALSREMEAVSQLYQNKMVLAADWLRQVRERHSRLLASPPDSQRSAPGAGN